MSTHPTITIPFKLLQSYSTLRTGCITEVEVVFYSLYLQRIGLYSLKKTHLSLKNTLVILYYPCKIHYFSKAKMHFISGCRRGYI